MFDPDCTRAGGIARELDALSCVHLFWQTKWPALDVCPRSKQAAYKGKAPEGPFTHLRPCDPEVDRPGAYPEAPVVPFTEPFSCIC